VFFLFVILCITFCAALDASEGVLPAAKHIDIRMANNPAGYYLKFDGGGLNALHVTTTTSEPYGQVTTSEEQSGTWYISDTGGRGFFDDGILMVGVNGEIPDNFKIHVRSSGYQWTPTAELNEPPTLENITYVAGAIDETFTKDQFIYGPQAWKPAGENAPMNFPIFYGQDTSDPNTRAKIIFVDLKVGALGPNSMLSDLTDNGMVKVEYSIEGLDTYATFNVYGWCNQSNQGKGISWTNQLVGEGSSGYTVIGTPYASHKSDFAVQSGGAVPHENQKKPINVSGSTVAGASSPVTTTTQKAPSGVLVCFAAVGMLLILRRIR